MCFPFKTRGGHRRSRWRVLKRSSSMLFIWGPTLSISSEFLSTMTKENTTNNTYFGVRSTSFSSRNWSSVRLHDETAPMSNATISSWSHLRLQAPAKNVDEQRTSSNAWDGTTITNCFSVSMSSHYFHEHDTAIETMSYNLHEHKEGIQPSSTSLDMDSRCIQNQRLKPKDSLSSHQDSITSLLASMHLSGITSFGDSFGDDSAPELLSQRYDDKELDKFFDFGESEKPDDAFATQSTASWIAQASLEFFFHIWTWGRQTPQAQTLAMSPRSYGAPTALTRWKSHQKGWRGFPTETRLVMEEKTQSMTSRMGAIVMAMVSTWQMSHRCNKLKNFEY